MGADEVPHLRWAQRLVADVRPAENAYASHPTYVVWADPAAGRVARNRSVCSSLVSHLLEQSYGYTPHDFASWFGVSVPQAADYYDTIAAENGFERIHHVENIKPGDLIAIHYAPGSHPTGHVVVVAAPPQQRSPSEPLGRGSRQYAVPVIDSATTGHGLADTRRAGDGWTQGVGSGEFRLYASDDELITGYAWSTLGVSEFRDVRDRPVAVGRLKLAAAPPPSGTAASASQPAVLVADDAPTDEV